MATVASLVGNPILCRNSHPKFSAAKLSPSRHASSVPISSSSSSSSSCLIFSAAEYPKVLGSRHASLCKPPNAIIIDPFGNIGKPLGRVGGNWTTEYPYDPRSSNYPWVLGVVFYIYIGCILLLTLLFDRAKVPVWHDVLLVIIYALMGRFLWKCRIKTVVKLQVGFSGKGRDIGFDLNQIAQSADTSTYKGLSYVLDETILALLRHCEYYNSASISVVSKFGRQEANLHIDRLSYEERANNKVTLLNVNNMKLQSPTSQNSANDRHNDNIMVTLLVGVGSDPKLPITIYNKNDLENVLHKLRPYATSNYLTAVETLWTPQVFSSSVVATSW